MKSQPTESFLGFSGLIFGAALLAIPILGSNGIIGALVAIYFCLLLTNSASRSSKRG